MQTPAADKLSKSESVRFQILRALEEDPGCTQRELAEKLGISLGRVNYCLRALMEKGLMKFNSYRTTGSKTRIAYLVTPKGVSERLAMTNRFLERKLLEYEELKAEIEALQRDGAENYIAD